MKIAFLGDIMPGGIIPYLEHSPISTAVFEELHQFDLRVATLEAAIGDNLPFDEVKMQGRGNIIYAPSESAKLLCDMDINVVTLANNHVFDLGVKGLENTCRWLDEHNIAYCGAGMNIDEATKPLIINRDGIKLAFIGCCSYDPSEVAYVPVATETSPGIAPLDLTAICSTISELKKTGHIVIVLPHWGHEYSPFPTRIAIDASGRMSHAGADLIVGSHTHYPQPHMRIKDTDVYFSLGNGLFPDFFVNAPRPIWYPAPGFDITAIKRTYDYPFPVTEPLCRVWSEESRISIMVSANISDTEIRTTSQFMRLSDDNILQFHADKLLSLKLKTIAATMRTAIYREGKILVLPKRIVSKFKRLLSK